MTAFKVSALVCAAAILLASTAVAVNIETVPVGNPGNPADAPSHSGNLAGQGAVGYIYNIGKFEVTAGQYCVFLNSVAKTDTYGLYNTSMADYWGCKIQRAGSSGSYTYNVAADWANRPVNYVSWGDAARFANWLHNSQATGRQNASTTEDGAYDMSATERFYDSNGQVPPDGSNDWFALNAALVAVSRKADWKWAISSEDEWYKAAYYDPHKPEGAGYWDYPTQSNSAPSNVLDPNGVNNANYDNYDGSHWIPTIGGPYWRTEVGAFGRSPGPYGTFDQGGNVFEWNEAVIEDYGQHRGTRGGDCDNSADWLAAWSRNSRWATEESNPGFRVVQVPEPATFSLLGLGTLALIRRGRR